jgi:hypothetical protein
VPAPAGSDQRAQPGSRISATVSGLLVPPADPAELVVARRDWLRDTDVRSAVH